MQKKVNLSDMTHLFDHVLNDFSKIEYLTELAFDSFLIKKKKVIMNVIEFYFTYSG